jgi:hypothetical protein
MNVNNKSTKNSFLSNNLKNTSESNISNQYQQKNLTPSNNNKNKINNIFLENYISKSKPKIMNEILSPNFSNDPKFYNKAPFPLDKDYHKISNNPAVKSTSIFNKLSFDNAISKKSLISLMLQQQDKNSVNNTFKTSFNNYEKNEKNLNINLNNNCNNLFNMNNLNNNKNVNNSNTKNNNSERVNLASAKNEPIILAKPNNKKKNLSGLSSKANEIIQFNNINNINNLNNLSLGFNSGLVNNNLSNNINLISNNNLNSAEGLASPIIPLLPTQQINVNINNYNINNFNIQSAIPLKSIKKFFKFENVDSSSSNKNLKNFENQLSPKIFSNLNNNIISLNNLNPLIHNGSNNNMIYNDNNFGLINFENREYFPVGGKKGFVNGNNARFNINKFFDDQQEKIRADGFAIDKNHKINEKLNFDSIDNKDREKSLTNKSLKKGLKNREGCIITLNNKQALKQQNSKYSNNMKQEHNYKNKNNIEDNYDIGSNININKKEDDSFTNINVIKNSLSNEIIFDPVYSAKIESVIIYL